MSGRFPLCAVAAVLLLLPASASVAQQPASAVRAAGPRLEVTAAGAHPLRLEARADTAQRAAAAVAQRQSMGRPVALMVVGGAAVILGAAIGDAPGTLFMIGGAVAFLYGLYHYLE